MWKEGTRRTVSHSGRYMTLCSSKRVLQTHTMPGEALWFYCLSFLSLCAGTLLPLSWILQSTGSVRTPTSRGPRLWPTTGPSWFLKSSHDFSSTSHPDPQVTHQRRHVSKNLVTNTPEKPTIFHSLLLWVKIQGGRSRRKKGRQLQRSWERQHPQCRHGSVAPPSNLNRSVSQSLNSSGWQL